MKWRPSGLSELTSITFDIELTNLSLEVSKCQWLFYLLLLKYLLCVLEEKPDNEQINFHGI